MDLCLLFLLCIAASASTAVSDDSDSEESVITNVQCHNRKEISPCTCLYKESTFTKKAMTVRCIGVESFSQVVNALTNQFERSIDISLVISHSKLDDLPQLSFSQLNLSISQLTLELDKLSEFPDSVFVGLGYMQYLSLADNNLKAIPRNILNLMPGIKTLNLNGCSIQTILTTDLENLKKLKHVMLAENNISMIEQSAFPNTLGTLTLSRNQIVSLNHTLRGMSDLQWLFLNGNRLESLDGELPKVDPNTRLRIISAEHNSLTHPPQDLLRCKRLNKLRLDNNKLVSLDAALSELEKLEYLNLTHNQIATLRTDDFAKLFQLVDLMLAHNNIIHLNGSLLPLRSLRNLFLSYNDISEFNLQDIFGLKQLNIVDLSHNNISLLSGRTENMVDLEIKIKDLRLEYNKLETLSGTLMGLHSLKSLNISHNCIVSISPDDFIGLDSLKILDISYNHLTTLEETSKTVLPSLDYLYASHNLVVALEKDFHGLPRLCWADLTYNLITDISLELVEFTHCQLHGVNSVLRIYLQGNSLLCQPEVLDKLQHMEATNNTKFHGLSECHNNLNEHVSQHPFLKRN